MAATDFPPAKACDSHVHVIGPKARFPLAPGHRYTPQDAPAAALAAMLGRLGLQRVVLVQPSFYGTDNACMLDAMAQIAGARGVAVLAEETPTQALEALDAQGVRGLRVNIATAGAAPIEDIKRKIAGAARLCEWHGWHVQVFVPADAIEPLAPFIRTLPVGVVFDHFGLIAPGTTSGPLAALCRLLESGNVWVKISGAYRIADDPNDARIDPLARALCQGQSRTHRLGLGLAAHAQARHPHRQRHRIAVPGYRHARAAASAAALARGRRAGQARAGR